MHYMKSLCRTLYCIVCGSQWLLLTKVRGCKGQEEGTLLLQHVTTQKSLHRNQLTELWVKMCITTVFSLCTQSNLRD